MCGDKNRNKVILSDFTGGALSRMMAISIVEIITVTCYYKLRQGIIGNYITYYKNWEVVITIVSGTTNYGRFYYNVCQVLQNVTVIKKWVIAVLFSLTNNMLHTSPDINK